MNAAPLGPESLDLPPTVSVDVSWAIQQAMPAAGENEGGAVERSSATPRVAFVVRRRR